jgi:hypothetical protein
LKKLLSFFIIDFSRTDKGILSSRYVLAHVGNIHTSHLYTNLKSGILYIRDKSNENTLNSCIHIVLEPPKLGVKTPKDNIGGDQL